MPCCPRGSWLRAPIPPAMEMVWGIGCTPYTYVTAAGTRSTSYAHGVGYRVYTLSPRGTWLRAPVPPAMGVYAAEHAGTPPRKVLCMLLCDRWACCTGLLETLLESAVRDSAGPCTAMHATRQRSKWTVSQIWRSLGHRGSARGELHIDCSFGSSNGFVPEMYIYIPLLFDAV